MNQRFKTCKRSTASIGNWLLVCWSIGKIDSGHFIDAMRRHVNTSDVSVRSPTQAAIGVDHFGRVNKVALSHDQTIASTSVSFRECCAIG